MTLPQIAPDDFVRRFPLRAKGLMWLLGAGASASAGIPTAGDMVWEFKQLLFISQRRVMPQSVADLSNPTIRQQLQAHINSSGHMPSPGAADEYATLFEAAYPGEADRRAYMEAKIRGAKPSYGHMALATLMREQLVRLVWTTNFDSLLADACAKIYDTTGQLTSVALDAPDIAARAIGDERWPIEVKLHGDFRSRRLKNTPDELRQQDARLRQLLVESSRRFGLVVVGYSGRDDSVMDTLTEALQHKGSFPGGLFWLHRGEDQPSPRVSRLLEHAAKMDVESGLVSVENFDEALRDLVRLIKDLDTRALDAFAGERRRCSDAAYPSGGRGWPVVRLNALPANQIPTVCRRVVCQVGGYAEVREAVERAGVKVLVGRTRAGVLAYGADTDVRRVFEGFGITQFDLHTIEIKRLRYDSGERGLLRDALVTAITRQRHMRVVRRRNDLAPADPEEAMWKALQRLVGTLSGTLRSEPELRWREGISIRLDWADERMWVLLEPRVLFENVADSNKAIAADFARERVVRRYNRQLNDLFDFWASTLVGDGSELRALGVGDGVDAVFRLSPDTCFSQRARV